jgi:hypothetical protein
MGKPNYVPFLFQARIFVFGLPIVIHRYFLIGDFLYTWVREDFDLPAKSGDDLKASVLTNRSFSFVWSSIQPKTKLLP